MITVDLTQYLPETMPEKCWDCPFSREEANDDYDYIRLFCGLINEDFYQGSFWCPGRNVDFSIEKLNNCPLKEVGE